MTMRKTTYRTLAAAAALAAVVLPPAAPSVLSDVWDAPPAPIVTVSVAPSPDCSM